jgi:outer membrane lipoprotein-sorting protein
LAQDWAPVPLTDARVKTLRDGLAAMRSIQGDMTQTKTFSFMIKPLVSTGYFRYATGDRMRWEFVKPSAYCILIDGQKVRLKENGAEKDLRSVDRVMRQVKEVIIGCINGSIIADPAYKAEAWVKGQELRITMQPKDRRMRELIAGIEIIFGPTAKDLRSVRLTDPSGDATLVTFQSIRINESIADRTFTDF